MWPTLPPGLRGSRPTSSNWTFGFTLTVSWLDAASVGTSFDREQPTRRAPASGWQINGTDGGGTPTLTGLAGVGKLRIPGTDVAGGVRCSAGFGISHYFWTLWRTNTRRGERPGRACAPVKGGV